MIKKPILRFTVLAGSLLVALLVNVLTSTAQAEEIKSFSSDLTLTQDGTLDVEEEIVMDFQDAYRHGIFRNIPVTYRRGAGVYSINLKLKSITDENGNALPYRADRNGPDMNIRIGRAETTVTGVRAYRIHYQVNRALNFFDGAPELYWNVTGTDWPFHIARCVAYFHPPSSVPLKDLRSKVFVGERGSRKTGRVGEKEDSLVVLANNLAPGENMTLVIGMPKGSIPPPSMLDDILGFCQDWLGAVLAPILTGLTLYFYWHTFGRDQMAVSAVSVEWTPPPDLTPAEVGTLIDEKCDIPDVVSTLVDLASRGYLHIKPIPYNGILFLSKKDYQFTKTDPPKKGPPLKPHELLFLNALFPPNESVNYLSSLSGRFSLDIPYIKQAIWGELASKKLFFRDPDTDRQWFYILAFILFMIGAITALLGDNASRATGFGLVISAAITGLAARAMPARTAAGSLAVARCKAFQRFVKTTEKKRIEVLAKEDPTIFGRLLPYAMVLGAADQWANAFKDLIMAPPDWYDNSAFGWSGPFSPYTFVDDLGQSLRTINAGFAAPPPMPASGSSWSSGGGGGGYSGFSDGGGFSGGGFGGGGGGSW